MSVPSDPVDVLKWAWEHMDRAWWLIVAIGAGIAWTRKRMSDWSRRNAIAIGRAKLAAVPQATPASAAAYAAATSYAASAYAAQPAYAAPPAAGHAGSSGRKLHRESAPAQRTVAPVARSVDVPVRAVPAASGGAPSGTWTLARAFGDPAHARTAIVVAEVLGPPRGLR